MIAAWERYEAGADAAEDIAHHLGISLAKKDPPILSTPGYEQAVRSLLRAFGGTVRDADKAAYAAAATKLDADWPSLSAAERERVIRGAAKSILGVPEIVIGKVTKSIAASMTQVVTITKRDARRVYRLGIQPTFTARDEKIINSAAKSQGNYITDRYANRAEAFSQRARDIVSKGLEGGAGRQDIGAILREQLVGPALRTSEAYWETVASVHIARARSWGQLAGFEEAGITVYEFEAVLDSETTDQCRFLHGRRFEVGKALDSFEAVEADGASDAVERLQPWMRVGKTSDGGQALFVDRGNGSRKMVARVEESGVGQDDKTGRYSGDIGVAAMQKLGVGMPPVHCRCRSTCLPA